MRSLYPTSFAYDKSFAYKKKDNNSFLCFLRDTGWPFLCAGKEGLLKSLILKEVSLVGILSFLYLLIEDFNGKEGFEEIREVCSARDTSCA